MKTKQVAIHVSRKLTLNRAGQPAVVLEAGRNVVDEDVAEHPFVKHHTVDSATLVAAGDIAALHARVAELQAQLDEKGGAALKAANEHVAELQQRLAERNDAYAALEQEVAGLKTQLEQKDADMTALVTSMSAPAAPAEAKAGSKAK